MSFFTSVYFVILLCLVGLLVVLLLIKEIIRILSINKIRAGKDKGASYVCDLLCERFPDATVYKNVRFLKEEAENDGLKCACDVVYISRGGVLLMTVLPDTGNYDNPKIGPWRHRYINTRKEVVTLQKSNPFDTMAFFSAVTEKLMIAENVLNPSVTRTVVFSADLVDFTTEYPECLTVGTLFDYVEAFNKRKHLNKDEYLKVCQAVTACSDYLEGLARKKEDVSKKSTAEEPAKAQAQDVLDKRVSDADASNQDLQKEAPAKEPSLRDGAPDSDIRNEDQSDDSASDNSMTKVIMTKGSAKEQVSEEPQA